MLAVGFVPEAHLYPVEVAVLTLLVYQVAVARVHGERLAVGERKPLRLALHGLVQIPVQHDALHAVVVRIDHVREVATGKVADAGLLALIAHTEPSVEVLRSLLLVIIFVLLKLLKRFSQVVRHRLQHVDLPLITVIVFIDSDDVVHPPVAFLLA